MGEQVEDEEAPEGRKKSYDTDTAGTTQTPTSQPL